MEDLIFTPIVIGLGLLIHQVVLRYHSRDQGRLLTLSFIGHLAAAFLQVLLVLYYFPGGGDILAYYHTAVPAAEFLRVDFFAYAPEIIKTFLQMPDAHLPVDFFGASSTLSMNALASFAYFLLGDSLYASGVLFAVVSYVSQVMIFRALRPEFEGAEDRAVLVGATLLPSAVFWSSAVLKEPVVIGALGPLMLGLRWFADGHRRMVAPFLFIPAAVVMAMLKPYVLMALSVSAAVFYLRKRGAGRKARLRPATLVLAAAIAYGGLVLGNRYFSKSNEGDESAASTVAYQRHSGYEIEGGSNYKLDSGNDDQEGGNRSLTSELALAPLALLTALFRPLLFEARNAVQFANALEATALLVIALQLLKRPGWRGVVRAVRQSPTLMFCLVFTLALGVGTGLASSNLGSLSRYRAPMMPFFFVFLLVLRARGARALVKVPGPILPGPPASQLDLARR